tara:strand:+ start:76 stop:552 length:477 start_codon:yes stop_codon:yes gene_type:complete
MKVWIVATYKVKELKNLQQNLQNQKLEYYIAKIKTQKFNSISKEEPLVPGYIFIKAKIDQYAQIAYTKGIKNIIRFSNNIAILHDDEINQLKKIEEQSFFEPIPRRVFVGQDAIMSEGPLKGAFIKIASFPKKERVDIFLNILGEKRMVSVPLSEIKL